MASLVKPVSTYCRGGIFAMFMFSIKMYFKAAIYRIRQTLILPISVDSQERILLYHFLLPL